jgi:dipeptidyl aminopeptidase/acylaminoacyl peptidase
MISCKVCNSFSNSSKRQRLASGRHSRWLTAIAVLLFVVAARICLADAPTESTQFGARRLDFAVGEGKGFVILPAKSAADGSKPWVWYAPTFAGKLPDDSHTWMAKQLLDAGFAICGVDVGESFGSPAGRKLYSEFYGEVRKKFKLDRKPCLLAQSRGGLMLLNWAAENASRVRCIAGIYAVCNLESYPGVEKASAAYRMDAAELRARLAKNNPIDRVKPLAKAKVPMLFIHGDSDKVVPIEANAGEYVARCKTLGGIASVIVVPGKGHEVCPQFFESQPFVDFLLTRGQKRPAS